MNKKLRTSLIVLIAVILLVTMTSAAFAGNRQEFSLPYDVTRMADQNFRADGTFYFTIGSDDWGEAHLTWAHNIIRPNTIVFDGGYGSFTAQMMINEQTGDDCWAGKIIIWPSWGTIDYENMGGSGLFTLCREEVGEDVRYYGDIDGWFSEYVGKGG